MSWYNRHDNNYYLVAISVAKRAAIFIKDSLKLAWAAGFFDGEGYVTIGQRGPYKGHKAHYLRVGINHVGKKPLYVMQELLGGCLQYQNPEKVRGNRIPRTRWITNGSTAASVLKLLLPYLVNKKEVALLGLELHSTMRHGRKVTPEMYAYREGIKQKIKDLNAKD